MPVFGVSVCTVGVFVGLWIAHGDHPWLQVRQKYSISTLVVRPTRRATSSFAGIDVVVLMTSPPRVFMTPSCALRHRTRGPAVAT